MTLSRWDWCEIDRVEIDEDGREYAVCHVRGWHPAWWWYCSAAWWRACQEIIAYLKTKLEIPEGVVGLTLHLRVDEIITVDCQYYPALKGGDE